MAHVTYFRLPVSKAFPRLLVPLRLSASRVLDFRDGEVREQLQLGEEQIRTIDWRAEKRRGKEALTQTWGHALSSAGFEAVIVPSSADPSGANAIVFPEDFRRGSEFTLVGTIAWPVA